MKQISEMTKDRLKEAVHDMAILTDDGMHPTNALVKVAQSLDLTEDQVRLVGRAYNTAHTADVREKGATILEKLATTPIADCEDAVSRYTNTKTASAEEVAEIYSTHRDVNALKGLSVKVAADLDLQDWVKTASVKKAEPKKEISMKKLLSDQVFLREQVTKLACQADRFKDRLDAALQVLYKYAAKASDEERLAVKLAAVQRFGKEVLDYIEEAVPIETSTSKIASVNPSLMNCVEATIDAGTQLRETVYVLNKTAQCLNRVNAELEKRANPTPSGGGGGFPGKNLLTNYLLFDKVFNKDTGAAPPENPTNVLPSRLVQHGIATPEHKRKMDSIRVKSMLNDMLSNDDIISQYDPDEVYKVFNDLRATAPEVMLRPSTARSFVRETLAKGQLGSYDLNPLMSYEKDLMRNVTRNT